MDKTLIGKEDYLFLSNDSSHELEIHCNNRCNVSDPLLTRYNFPNFLLVVFPDKSIIYKNYLPNNFNPQFRPAIGIYKNKFGNNLLDCYDFLKDIPNTYFKTDTHINLNGNYYVYQEFIKRINSIFSFKFKPKKLQIESINCILNDLNLRLGDLTWSKNLGGQFLYDKMDTYFFSKKLKDFYPNHVIQNKKGLRFYSYDMGDVTSQLAEQNRKFDWEVSSNYILHKINYKKSKNKKKSVRVVIFYDSFLLYVLPLYFSMFFEVFMIKDQYNPQLIQLLNPSYVFEFRVERFLN